MLIAIEYTESVFIAIAKKVSRWGFVMYSLTTKMFDQMEIIASYSMSGNPCSQKFSLLQMFQWQRMSI